jgi:hypothetical protein
MFLKLYFEQSAIYYERLFIARVVPEIFFAVLCGLPAQRRTAGEPIDAKRTAGPNR